MADQRPQQVPGAPRRGRRHNTGGSRAQLEAAQTRRKSAGAAPQRQRQQAAGSEGQDDHPPRLLPDRHRLAVRVRRKRASRDHGPPGQGGRRRRAGARRPAPVYPKIDYNGGYPTCSPLAVSRSAPARAPPARRHPDDAADYDSKVLKPAVDYATSKGLYVIIDDHQIDNATTGTSAADATTSGPTSRPVRRLQQRALRALQRADRRERWLGRAEAGRPGLDRHHSCRRAATTSSSSLPRAGPAPGDAAATHRRERT